MIRSCFIGDVQNKPRGLRISIQLLQRFSYFWYDSIEEARCFNSNGGKWDFRNIELNTTILWQTQTPLSEHMLLKIQWLIIIIKQLLGSILQIKQTQMHIWYYMMLSQHLSTVQELQHFLLYNILANMRKQDHQVSTVQQYVNILVTVSHNNNKNTLAALVALKTESNTQYTSTVKFI